MKLLQLNQNKIKMAGVADSFDRLPHTDHKDGAFRLRRYSVIELRTSFWNAKTEAEITHLTHRDFKQSKEFNKHQGGMIRSFEEIEEEVLQSEAMKEMCLTFKNAFDMIEGQEIEIHQMRVITCGERFANGTPVSPEGVHRDGFNYIAMIGVNRYNIDGGELLVYEKKDSKPFIVRELEDGEIIMLKDDELWHNASPINKIDKAHEGYGDWFIFCAKI